MVYILFVLGFILLIKGADMLVEGASSLAKKFAVSEIIIGLTIVAFGTSVPELVVNVISSISGNSGLVIGNILGSNIANILLILGISAIICPLIITKKTIFVEVPFSVLAIVLLDVLINDKIFRGSILSTLTRVDGLILLFFFALFMRYIFYISKKKQDLPVEVEIIPMSLTQMIIYIVVGLIGLTIGGKWVVDGALAISNVLGLAQSLVGLSIVALGTSLPELTTSIVAVMKKKSDIAIGNVVGSNIFNILRVLGISAVISPISDTVGTDKAIGFTLFVSALLFVFVLIGKKFVLQRYQGRIMVLFYIVYMSIIFMNAF